MVRPCIHQVVTGYFSHCHGDQRGVCNGYNIGSLKKLGDKVRASSWSELVKKGIVNPNTWAHLTESEKQIRRDNLSTKVSGSGNGAYGTKIYIDENHNGDLPPTTILNKQRYMPGDQPKGWIPVVEWRDRKKNKKANAYGRHWYNDGQKNYYLYPVDAKISELQLEKRRLINI